MLNANNHDYNMIIASQDSGKKYTILLLTNKNIVINRQNRLIILL